MAGGYTPGSICQNTTPQNVEDGTICRAQTPAPGPLGLCTAKGPGDFSWGYWDVVVWKILPAWIGGDPSLLRRYKDAWVRDHKSQIKSLSGQYRLPPELLAGVAWIEAGGKPYDLKIKVYEARRHSVVVYFNKPPELTSMGPVAIQLRRAAETMGVDFNKLSEDDKAQLVDCLQNADNDLAIVARHLWQLKQIDFPAAGLLGPYQIRVIGSRYNRGPDLPLARILQDTSYGDFIVKRISTLQGLLAD